MRAAWRIRSAQPEEADALTAIAQAAKRSWGYPEGWLASWRDALTIRAEALSAWSVFVALANGKPVGFVAIRPTESRWELEHLWVLPAYQRRGIGRALMDHAISYASATDRTVLRIESDPHAVGFYRSMGAAEAGDVTAPMPGAPARVLSVLELHLARRHPEEHAVRSGTT